MLRAATDAVAVGEDDADAVSSGEGEGTSVAEGVGDSCANAVVSESASKNVNADAFVMSSGVETSLNISELRKATQQRETPRLRSE